MTTTPDIRQLVDAHPGDVAIGSEGEALAVLRDDSRLPWELLTEVDGKASSDWVSHDELHPFVSVVLTGTQVAACIKAGLNPEPVPTLGDRLAGWGRNVDVPSRSRLEVAAESLTIEQARGLLRLADAVRERLGGLQQAPTIHPRIPVASPLAGRAVRDEPQA